MDYADFIDSKRSRFQPVGFECSHLNQKLFEWQRDIVKWALRKGRAALFEDCGLGKTFQQIEWARAVCEHTGGRVLILAPLAVAKQTSHEASKLSVAVTVCLTGEDVKDGINVTNYERLHHFSPEGWSGIVLDESSILKSFDGSTRKQITEFAEAIQYRLCCTATPSPNDHMELGTHAEFLGVMKRSEMLSKYFVHDGADTSKWRLKRHAETEFWKWVCSWAVAIRKPSDIGYSDDGWVLPELRIHQVTVDAEFDSGTLFPVEAKTLEERREARKQSLPNRIAAAADLVKNGGKDPWLIWCDLNAESEGLANAIPRAIEVRGSQEHSDKERILDDFSSGKVKRLVTKPSIAGFGMNWQHCNRMIFVGLSDSYEALYQSIRRCWRFGQQRPVDVYVVTGTHEGAVVRNIERKEALYTRMMDEMVVHMQTEMTREVRGEIERATSAESRIEMGDGFVAYQGDCVDLVGKMNSNSVGYSIFSPPFASLYTYSDSPLDMGNSDGEQFERHFKFLVPELFRVLMPGRLLSFHCMNLPTSKERDGFIGIRDFRGDLIRWFVDAGFIFHSEVVIWKDPVTAMQRTKALGLLYKQLRKDSAMSRQGIPDYLVTMRKPGVNTEPVTKTHESFPVDLWQRYASPVWMDINPSDTLTKEEARDDDDERHICPLQLDVIRRAIRLWTNPGDAVLSPFMGIGSEGFVAIEQGRRFIGTELKDTYFDQAIKNLRAAKSKQGNLFDEELAETA